jgi:hypothetical protein
MLQIIMAIKATSTGLKAQIVLLNHTRILLHLHASQTCLSGTAFNLVGKALDCLNEN